MSVDNIFTDLAKYKKQNEKLEIRVRVLETELADTRTQLILAETLVKKLEREIEQAPHKIRERQAQAFGACISEYLNAKTL